LPRHHNNNIIIKSDLFQEFNLVDVIALKSIVNHSLARWSHRIKESRERFSCNSVTTWALQVIIKTRFVRVGHFTNVSLGRWILLELLQLTFDSAFASHHSVIGFEDAHVCQFCKQNYQQKSLKTLAITNRKICSPSVLHR
jgi:hypothetical protein